MSAPGCLRIVLFREAECWLAQGLEHDIGVQGEHLHDVVLRFDLALRELGAAISSVPEAPAYFQALWPLRAGDFTPTKSLEHLPACLAARFGIAA